ncbi:MAG: Mur ligase family protein [Candidatus Komeilibacteria bacterium]|nr:Mur ligase family protein [Candidatus Komeilibacteria bacterium]
MMFFRYLLKIPVKKIMKKYRPLTIGVTGSFNKTSAAGAIYTIIRQLRGQVRLSSEIADYTKSIYLAVIGASANSRWWKVFWQALKLIFKEDKNYPGTLVLEVGAVKPGEIGELAEIIPFDIAVITGINPEQFGPFANRAELVKEELSILKHFEGQAKIVVLNGDDEELKKIKNQLKARVVTYGEAEDNDYQFTDKKIIEKNGSLGTIFKLHYRGRTVPVFLPGIFGLQVYACFAALAFAEALYSNILEAIDALYMYRPEPERTNLIAGIKEINLD